MQKIGLKVKSIADILSLDKRDYLQRRLQTVVANKRLSTTVRGARQLISHKKILVDGRVVDSPSYIVKTELERKITLKKDKVKKKLETKKEEKND